MNLEQLLKVLRDVVDYFDAHNMFKNGSVDFANLQDDLAFVTAVEQSLKKNGVDVPNQVDKIISMLPLISQFVH